MDIRLAYGKTGLQVELDDRWNVQFVEPRFAPGLPDPFQALVEALRSPIGSAPLAALVKPHDQVGIIVNDITRATPTPIMLKAVLQEISYIPSENITIFIALGTHRPNTLEELSTMIGEEFATGYRIVQNNAFDPATQVHLGQTSQGHDIWINGELMKCNVKILTGFIEPHFFAGFSGAGKAVMPGMAGIETILCNHCAQNIAHPLATWGHTWGNPIWEEVREVALKAQSTFLLNVTLNRAKEITAIFAGDLDAAHTQGVEYARQTAMVRVEQPFDIVVTTNSGYPLDLNLYQAVKGMSAAAQVVRQEGAILSAAECWDGIPSHGLFWELLKESANPDDLLKRIMQPGFSKQDQWEAQVLAQILQKAQVHLYTPNLTDEQIRTAMLIPSRDIHRTLEHLIQDYGGNPRICVMPEGPQTIPYCQ
ncbi:MAG TPA: nickel-dependent lactate racemase [Anaerolineaceae bacterium]|jgi:lactate racemase